MKQLLDIHASALMLAASQRYAEKLHPFDYIYRAIDCRIRALEEPEREAQFILKYIHSSCDNVKIHGIYKLERPGQLIVRLIRQSRLMSGCRFICFLAR